MNRRNRLSRITRDVFIGSQSQAGGRKAAQELSAKAFACSGLLYTAILFGNRLLKPVVLNDSICPVKKD